MKTILEKKTLNTASLSKISLKSMANLSLLTMSAWKWKRENFWLFWVPVDRGSQLFWWWSLVSKHPLQEKFCLMGKIFFSSHLTSEISGLPFKIMPSFRTWRFSITSPFLCAGGKWASRILRRMFEKYWIRLNWKNFVIVFQDSLVAGSNNAYHWRGLLFIIRQYSFWMSHWEHWIKNYAKICSWRLNISTNPLVSRWYMSPMIKAKP